MADLIYAIGPWQWVTEDGQSYWSAPSGTRGLVDLRGLPSQALAGDLGDRPHGFFAVDPAVGVSSDYEVFGRGDAREISVNGGMRNKWQSLLGYKPNGDWLIDLLWDQLTTGSDPSGGTPTPPLMPTVRGNLELRLGGHSLVKSERYRHGQHAHTAKVEDVLRRQFRRQFDANSEHSRRVLDYWLEKYRIDKGDWQRFVPSDLRSEIPGPLPHQTTVSDDFNRADSATLGASWTEDDGNLSIISNEVGLSATGTFPRTNARYETDLSSDDHYSQLVSVVLPDDFSFAGVCARYSTSEVTFYHGAARVGAGSSHIIFKVVSGSGTLLFDSNPALPSLPFATKLEVNGSSLELFSDGVSRLSGTDTAITAHLRTGILFRAVDTGERGDDFEAADLSASDITISSPDQYQTFQRDGSDQADIAISGTYTGSPTAIEASFNGGAFATIDASPSGGTYSGTLSGQAAGQGTLTVRFTNDTGVSATVSDVGIGDVFLVAGQSNAEGRLTNLQSYSHATLKATMFSESDAWAELADPTDPDTSSGSVWPLLATSIMAETSLPVAFITAGEGASGLVDTSEWDKTGTATAYDNCVAQVTASGVNDILAVLWYQGERDAKNSVSANDYAIGLSALIDNLQTDTGFASMKLISAIIGESDTASAAQLDAIREGIIDRWDNDADILAGPLTHDEDFADDLHWTTDTQGQRLADRWWRCVLAHFFGGSEDARGPRLSSASFSDDEITIELTGGVSPLTNGTDTTGWSVTDGNGTRTVSSASSSGLTVTLTCDQSLVAPVTASYGSGETAVGATQRDSGTVEAFPIEPFVEESVSADSVLLPLLNHYMMS